VRCIACLNETVNVALYEQQLSELVRTDDFSALLRRIAKRSYGFAARENYLLLVSLGKLPSMQAAAASVEEMMVRCLEQLSHDLGDLTDAQLAHTTSLILKLPLRLHATDSINRAQEALKDALIARASFMKGKELCAVAEAVAAWPGLVHSTALRDQLSATMADAAAQRLDSMTPSQLAELSLSLTSLSLREHSVLKTHIFPRVALATEQLTPKQVASMRLALAAASGEVVRVGNEPAKSDLDTQGPLLHRAATVAHFCSSTDAIRLLWALSACLFFPPQLVQTLATCAARTPRSSLAVQDDNRLHQVALSLAVERDAVPALQVVQARKDLWDVLYQPDDVVGEMEEAEDDDISQPLGQIGQALVEAASRVDAHAEQVTSVLFGGFYQALALVSCVGKDGRVAKVALLDSKARCLAEPSCVWQGLKQRHLEFGGFTVAWIDGNHSPGDTGLNIMVDVLKTALNKSHDDQAPRRR